MLTAHAYDADVDQLFEKVRRLHAALTEAGIPYRVVGGVAIHFQVAARDSGKGRMTEDVDVAVKRTDLSRIATATEDYGFEHRRVSGNDMLVDASEPRGSSAVHLIFLNEKIRPDYLEIVPASEPVRTAEGIFVAPVTDLVHMKLTSFRLKDRVHIQDLDSVGLITPDIEATLSAPLAARLAEIRATP
jgi:hypothetical protein